MIERLAFLKELASQGLGAPVFLIILLAMVVIPLSPWILDLLFTFNIALSLIILLVSVYVLRPLEFAVFPTVLLVGTLLRLALNIASTRLVLLQGHTGTDAAGRVIQAFGEFVVGGNYTVGLVIFAILVIINFVVITKGATRVSEVSARFTLDALPGKQMAIDADLNAGLITQEEAKARRAEVMQEADFYGAMDGASKFVRGDAIAGILILFINILGGLAVGTLQHHLSLGEAMENYTLLTVGDGLVAQIPALLLSTAAAIMVTRVSSAQDMGQQVLSQLFGNPRVLGVAAGIVGFMGLIPGMPNLPFLLFALLGGTMAYRMAQRPREAAEGPAPPPPVPEEGRELDWEDVAPVDAIGLEVGYRLIPLVDKHQGGELLAKIRGVRRKLSQELGFLIPPVHIKDNLDLAPNAYRITLKGVVAAEGEVYPDRELAINPGHTRGTLPGTPTRDPAFGLPAVWIPKEQRELAQTQGYTVVDPSTVVATHLNQVLLNHADRLLGYEEVQKLLDRLAGQAPKLVEDLVPNTLPLRVVVKVLQNLLAEGIPLRNLQTIAETLVEYGAQTQDPEALTEAVRAALGGFIVQHIYGLRDELPVMTLAPALEQILQQSRQAAQGEAALEPGLAERLHRALQEAAKERERMGEPAVLLVSAPLRPMLARFARHSIPGLHVLSYHEIPDDKRIKIVATIGA
ncbi:MAG: flagellar biosynthesis protein FlhA [Gammaproteobacteria bacterium]|nr:MAG: flagellar biosynthesis protein FlhA [Gammaproteobacteria bacterium]